MKGPQWPGNCRATTRYCCARCGSLAYRLGARPLSTHCTAAAAAKGGSKALKPFLSTLYQTRARAYRDAVQQFVEGYKQAGAGGSGHALGWRCMPRLLPPCS